MYFVHKTSKMKIDGKNPIDIPMGRFILPEKVIIIILSVVLHDCKTWSLAVRREESHRYI
jgi:hypothetical protein